MKGRIPLHLRTLRRDERGIAVPTAMMALVASFALASVAVLSTVDAQRGTVRDHASKEAIAAADAGSNIALLRLNRYLPSLSVAKPCIGPAGESQTPSAGWCPSTVSEPVGAAAFSYRVSTYNGSGPLTVVSVGTAGGVSRRVSLTLNSVNGKNVFANEKLIGQDNIEVGGSSNIRTDVGTNGNIEGNGNPTFCGNLRHGIGKTSPTPSCGKEKTEGNKNLPPITPPSNIATENDDCRLAQNCTGTKAGKVDTYSAKIGKTDPWDAANKIINVNGQATLTMGGNDYWVCGLFINAGKIFMAAGSQMRIFIDTPEHCGLSSGAVQVEIKGNANIESTGYNPQQGLYEVPAIYLLGNGAVNLAGTSGSNEMILYAPYSAIDIGGNATWKGMIAGKSLNIHGTPTIESDPNIKPPEIFLASLFERTRYVECTGSTASPPDASC